MMNSYSNIKKMVELSEKSWEYAQNEDFTAIPVEYNKPPEMRYKDHEFINLCSCSYLGLDTHPEILQGAIDGVVEVKSLHLATARSRLYTSYLGKLEEKFSEHFSCNATVYMSCSSATASYLPLFASGILTNGVKPLMIFDRFSHASIYHVKPICGDETEIITCPHNDMEFIESYCRKESRPVIYVGDGTYSVAGHTHIQDLVNLQEKYGLYLFLDDSHGLSITGKLGEGFVRQNIPQLDSRTVVVASLAKAFGAGGGLLMSGDDDKSNFRNTLIRYGNSWSQYVNSAGIGASLASLELHRSSELLKLQQKWKNNLFLFDKYFNVQNSGTESPIRILQLKSPNRAVALAKKIFNEGFYTSAVFFPVVPRDKAGLRIMPRADIPEIEMQRFCEVVSRLCGEDLDNAHYNE